MLRVRDTIDRDYDTELDVEALARLVHVSPDHLIRTFRSVFGETPHRYLQRRRIERAMFLLRTTDLDVTEVCLAVGFTSLGTFSRLFSAVVGRVAVGVRRRRGRAAGARLLHDGVDAAEHLHAPVGRHVGFGEAGGAGPR